VGVLGGDAAGQSARPLTGYAIDSSNQVGSGGINSPVSTRSVNAANLFVTGNVAGGRRFLGFSPIRDPNSLLMPLPTSGLSGFRGDSIGIGDILQGRTNYQTNPFFDASSTVTNAVGIARGLNQPGSSVFQSPYLVPRDAPSTKAITGSFADTLSPLSRGVGYGETEWPTVPNAYALTPQSYTERLDLGSPPSLAQSPLFGTTAPWTLVPEKPAPLGVPPVDLVRPGGPGREEGPAAGGRVLGSLFKSRSTLSPADVAPEVFALKPSGAADAAAMPAGQPATEAVTSPLLPPPETEGPASSGATGVDSSGGLALEFAPQGISVYADIMQAVEWLRRRAEQEAGTTLPPGAVQRARSSLEQARALLSQPLDSYAGRVESEVNQYIIEAEACTRKGDYYRASGIYREAAVLDRDNPLIHLGHGHALLFAGDYLGAVYHLTRGIERFPAIAYVKTDLRSFVSDPTLLDVRRADLEDRLKRREDYQLRFLLGYAEYYSGLEKFGLPDLQRAAAEAPADSVIARFPDLLVIDEDLIRSPGAPDDVERR
jgi:hypothetical protein